MKSVRICTSCAYKNIKDDSFDLNAFLDSVRRDLKKARPELEWDVQRSSCYRFCPDDKLVVLVTEIGTEARRKLSMSRTATQASLVEEILSLVTVYFP